MGVVHPLGRFVELHEQAGIAGIETCRHTVFGGTDFGVDFTVLHHQVVGVAEGQEWPES